MVQIIVLFLSTFLAWLLAMAAQVGYTFKVIPRTSASFIESLL